jgi:hypothetical protein
MASMLSRSFGLHARVDARCTSDPVLHHDLRAEHSHEILCRQPTLEVNLFTEITVAMHRETESP